MKEEDEDIWLHDDGEWFMGPAREAFNKQPLLVRWWQKFLAWFTGLNKRW